jgi:endoglucanase Acf2/chitodextrinase
VSGQIEQFAAGVTRSGGRRHAGRVLALAALAALLASALQAVALPAPGASAVTVGSGSYAEGTPAGGTAPQDCAGGIMDPRSRTTANFPAGAVPTNDWWTSLLWNKINCTDESANLMAHPLAFHSFTNGLGVSYPTNASISGTSTGVSEYHYNYAEDLRIGIAGLTAPGKVDSYSDWTVTEQWSNGGSSLRATIGHGLPFVYATKTGGDVRLTLTAPPAVWRNAGGAIGFTVNGHDYAAFGPSGSSWSVSGTTISSSLAGGAFFSLAVLPTSSNNTARAAALDTYAPYAHNHVTGTRVSWAYNESTAKLTATYAFTTVAKQGGGANGTVFALYPHQRDALSGVTPSAYSYVSPRGPMRVVIGASQFQTVSTFSGVLPQLANTGFASGSADLAQLSGYVDQVAGADPFAGFGEDTYWTGKALGRATQVIQIANLTGKTAARDSLVSAVRTRLTDWMTASPGETQRLFSYNPSWGTLIGYPASYGSDTELNDHHFHYGYYVVAAATVAQFDPSWAANSAYGGMVNTVIKDAANWDRGDTRFPFLRDFDIYAGHDWASGHGSFGAGNNQESSSEGMNFAAGLIMWGQATGNTTVRDLGIYLYTTQASAIHNYWFDTDDEAFPAAFGHSTVGMVWGDGGAYSTWFSAEPEMIQGINLLPSTAGHLYLGYDPGYIGRNLAELQTNNGGPATVWQDIIWEFQALADAPTALAQFRSQAGSYSVEEGESRAHTFYWLKNLSTVGTVDRTVTADTPLYAVFTTNGVRNHQAANMSGSAITVHFSDGVSLSVPARSVASSSGGSTGGGDTTAPSTPTGLTASGTTSSSTNLSWSASSDNVGVTGYEILLGGSVIGTVGGTAATVTGLAASTSYTFAVRAKDAAGNRSGASSSVSVTTSSTGGTGGGSVDATSRIEAESYSGMSGVQTEATSDAGGGENVGWIGNGDYLRYDGVDFGSTARTQFTARVASGAGAGISGLVTVRLDSRTAAPIGSFAVGNTGGWQNWQSIPANVQGTTGVHTVYLTFESGQPADYVNVNWFTFS